MSATVALALGWCGATNTAKAQVSGISYVFSPRAEYISWDADLGLENTGLYGGGLDINFGHYVGLEGFYLTNDDVDTDVATLPPVGGAFIDQRVQVDNYGANLIFRLASGPIVPFLRAGGGVMRFDPDDGATFRQINLRAGGGLSLGFSDRFRGVLYAEDSMFRLNRYRLVQGFGGGEVLPEDPDSDDLRHNLAVGAAVSVFLGGYDSSEETDLDRAFRDRFSGNLGGASVPLEPYVGRMTYASAFELGDQEFVGLRTGIDVGPYVGLRGYYWRGFNADFDDTDRVQSFGGEAQFNLNRGEGIVPYLLAGAGTLDFRDGFADSQGRSREDKTMLIVGGGLAVGIGQRVDLNLSARDHLFSQSDFEDVTNQDEVLSNWSYSVGLKVSLGGQSADQNRSERLVRERYPADAASPVSSDDVEERAEGQDRADRYQDDDRPLRRASDRAGTGAVQSHDGDRLVTFPVPTTGEVYIRYGEPGGVSIRSQTDHRGPAATPAATTSTPTSDRSAGMTLEEIRDVARTAVNDELRNNSTTDVRDPQREYSREYPEQVPAPSSNVGGPSLDARDLELMEMRLAERFDQRLDHLSDQLARTEMAARTAAENSEDAQQLASAQSHSDEWSPSSYEDRDRYEPSQTQEADRREFASRGQGDWETGPGSSLELGRILTFTGTSLSSPAQLILGARFDLGPVRSGSQFHFVPEVAAGVDDNPSFMVAGNLKWNLSSLTASRTFHPYLLGGVGILTFEEETQDHGRAEGVVNLGYGLTKQFANLTGFAEHEGVDLFRSHRLLLGLSWSLR